MIVYNKNLLSSKPNVKGGGLLNNIINSLPFELHLPGGYQFCGPGTKLEKRLQRGDLGINKLDAACREHDIAYSKYKDLENRHKADRILEENAWNRFKSIDSGLGERLNALLVNKSMKAKRSLGMGLAKRKVKIKRLKHKMRKGSSISNAASSSSSSMVDKNKKYRANSLRKQKRNNKRGVTCGSTLFKSAVKKAQKLINKFKPESIENAIKIADKEIKNVIKKRKMNTKNFRTIPIPKVGGFLPLIPVLTALGAIGGLASGGSSIARALNEVKNAKEQLNEAKRHNKTMESIAIGGKGIFLKPYRKGYGLYYKPYNTSKN